jgi:sucrose-6F-phosphate phosphohydrolase
LIVTEPLLFAADLDGTLLPNTERKAAEGCVERTRALLRDLLGAGCPVCYITGRHLSLAREGIGGFGLAPPSFWVCNVGTEIYDTMGVVDRGWTVSLGPAFEHMLMYAELDGIRGLEPQEDAKQGPHKFSLYCREPASAQLRAEILERMLALRGDLRLVHSVEEASGRGLLDVIPIQAGKAAALHYLADRHGIPYPRVFFAGDSGNDFDALLSGVCGTLVGNAPRAVREEAARLQAESTGARLHLARAFYGDGILEGMRRFKLLAEGYAP